VVKGECPLCRPPGDETLWQDGQCRVILAGDRDYPGFCRVVWNRHVAEMTDLSPAERSHLLGIVLGVEAALRELLHPDKINLASLGNQVPHLHWHVIPRHRNDAHFPDSVWSAPHRPGIRHALDVAALTATLHRHLGTPL
jgi:diadenosine tetraphosphate (Ap4A) HIT family hydrolase